MKRNFLTFLAIATLVSTSSTLAMDTPLAASAMDAHTTPIKMTTDTPQKIHTTPIRMTRELAKELKENGFITTPEGKFKLGNDSHELDLLLQGDYLSSQNGEESVLFTNSLMLTWDTGLTWPHSITQIVLKK
jgi:hypothetical protein